MIVLDHTEKSWVARYKYMNGALSYSKDLVAHQIPKWGEVLGENDIISTCARFSECEIGGNYDTAIQYLHSYPYYSDVLRIANIAKALPFSCKRLIFVTAYKAFETKLLNAGFNAVYVPMAIDVDAIQQHAQPKIEDNSIIYFGNIVHNKVGLFNKIKRACNNLNIPFYYISHSKFNNSTDISREETLQMVSTYKYGIGVGRCAQEMMALGVKVMIAGVKLGGLITNEEDYEKQLETNMNAR